MWGVSDVVVAVAVAHIWVEWECQFEESSPLHSSEPRQRPARIGVGLRGKTRQHDRLTGYVRNGS